MYISVPKNYSGNAFRAAQPPGPAGFAPPGTPGVSPPRGLPPGGLAPEGVTPRRKPPADCDCAPPRAEKFDEEEVLPEQPIEREREEPPNAACRDCGTSGTKNPMTCLFEALRGRRKSGFDTEDFLLIGLIALLMNKEGNEDIVLILAMLLLV